MIKYLITLVIITSFFSCDAPKQPTEKENNLISIYNGLKKDSIFTKFIGYHIVRRDNENYFMYRNLRIDSNEFVVPNLKAPIGTKDYKEKELFFKNNPDAKLQFDIMRKYGIKAVSTLNYNGKSKRLEHSYHVGYDFNNYQLIFTISDSIDLTNINFDLNEYLQLTNYMVKKKLDSNWLVLRRL
jgi:hypothetical protein